MEPKTRKATEEEKNAANDLANEMIELFESSGATRKCLSGAITIIIARDLIPYFANKISIDEIMEGYVEAVKVSHASLEKVGG